MTCSPSLASTRGRTLPAALATASFQVRVAWLASIGCRLHQGASELWHVPDKGLPAAAVNRHRVVAPARSALLPVRQRALGVGTASLWCWPRLRNHAKSHPDNTAVRCRGPSPTAADLCALCERYAPSLPDTSSACHTAARRVADSSQA